MKTIITIALLLCSIGVSAQSKTIKLSGDSVFKSSGTINLPAIGTSEYLKGYSGGMSGIYARASPKPLYHFVASDNRIMIKISYPDSNGFVKVWLNRKEITWTSDSTFVYKTEQR